MNARGLANLAIERGAIPASSRVFYQLDGSSAEVPLINTTSSALLWAANLSSGEANRVAAGGPAMAWPTIAQVNTTATALQNAENAQTAAKDAYDEAQELIASRRTGVDGHIKDLWDTIEYNLRADEPASLRRKAREWGVIYDGEDEEEETTPPTPPPTP